METPSGQSSPALPDTPPESVAGEPPNFSQNNQQHPHFPTCEVHTEPQDHTQNSTLPETHSIPFLSSPSGSPSPSRDFPSAASKDALRQLTRDILALTMPQSARDADDGISTLDPTKYDPSRSMEVPIVYNNHSSQSSTTDSSRSSGRQTMWKTLPDPPNPEAGHSPPVPLSYSAEPSQQHPRHLPQSKSDGNVKSLDSRVHEDTSFATKLYGDWGAGSYQHAAESQHNNTAGEYEGYRGRDRSRSPVKVLEDLDENYPLEFLTDAPRRRSRSPHKKLFGENGWLGKTPDIKDFQAEKNKKAGLKGLGEKIKQRVEDMTGDVIKSHGTGPEASKFPSKPKVPISLDPPTQAKLYSELELMICATANKFLVDQHRHGRLSPDSIAKITNFWTSKNRPQVVQFQYDQATQRDLILYNLRTLAFNGECARNPVLLNAIMYDWKAVAKEMSVRTFCYPDSVVRKHMHDTHKMLEMLGAPLVTFLAFQELQVNALALMKSEDAKKLSISTASGRNGSSGGYWFPESHEQDRS